MIDDLSEADFAELLHQHLSPSRPIDRSELLKGRDKKLQQIRESLTSRGRQVFIYGERGVGKTSLAQTAAGEHQRADADPVNLTCQADFWQLMKDLYQQCGIVGRRLPLKASVAARVPGFEFKLEHESQTQSPKFNSINEVIHALKTKLASHHIEPVVVFDEFDLLPTAEDRRLFAAFIKAVGDSAVPIKMFFTGIARSMGELLDAHGSAYRYLETIELERLDFESRMEIVEQCARALNVRVERTTLLRIAKVSDGFPYYVHLIAEKMFWEMYRDPQPVRESKAAHYMEGIKAAVSGTQAYLQVAYDKAVKKYGSSRYEEVMWAAADHPLLERPSSDIFESYLSIMQRLKKEPLSRAQFNSRMNRLKTDAHGPTLVGTRAGWYQFSDSILRGYVRLKAEAAGIELEADHPLAQLPKRRSGL